MRRRTSRNVTETELEILKVLWVEGPCSIRRLTDRLYPGGGAAHYATVQKLLERLRTKACVGRKQQGRRHLYVARVKRKDLIEEQLRRTAEKLCDGSFTPLLTQLVSSRRLSEPEISKLRELMNRLEQEEGTHE
jgi:BlaI family penicillinase repressor